MKSINNPEERFAAVMKSLRDGLMEAFDLLIKCPVCGGELDNSQNHEGVLSCEKHGQFNAEWNDHGGVDISWRFLIRGELEPVEEDPLPANKHGLGGYFVELFYFCSTTEERERVKWANVDIIAWDSGDGGCEFYNFRELTDGGVPLKEWTISKSHYPRLREELAKLNKRPA